jgi:hypothetical protein
MALVMSVVSLTLIAGILAACQRTRDAAFSCPQGSTLMGAPPPKGAEVWCQKIVNGRPIKNGMFVVYNDSGGKMIEGTYRNGVQEGEWTMWYENGQRSAIDHYHNGLQDGLHISWYANGQKALEGNYVAGKREGIWTRWDPSGLTKNQIRYKQGKIAG